MDPGTGALGSGSTFVTEKTCSFPNESLTQPCGTLAGNNPGTRELGAQQHTFGIYCESANFPTTPTTDWLNVIGSREIDQEFKTNTNTLDFRSNRVEIHRVLGDGVGDGAIGLEIIGYKNDAVITPEVGSTCSATDVLPLDAYNHVAVQVSETSATLLQVQVAVDDAGTFTPLLDCTLSYSGASFPHANVYWGSNSTTGSTWNGCYLKYYAWSHTAAVESDWILPRVLFWSGGLSHNPANLPADCTKSGASQCTVVDVLPTGECAGSGAACWATNVSPCTAVNCNGVWACTVSGAACTTEAEGTAVVSQVPPDATTANYYGTASSSFVQHTEFEPSPLDAAPGLAGSPFPGGLTSGPLDGVQAQCWMYGCSSPTCARSYCGISANDIFCNGGTLLGLQSSLSASQLYTTTLTEPCDSDYSGEFDVTNWLRRRVCAGTTAPCTSDLQCPGTECQVVSRLAIERETFGGTGIVVANEIGMLTSMMRDAAVTFTPTNTIAASLTPTPTRTPTITLTPISSFTPTPTPSATRTPTSAATFTPTRTFLSTPTRLPVLVAKEMSHGASANTFSAKQWPDLRMAIQAACAVASASQRVTVLVDEDFDGTAGTSGMTHLALVGGTGICGNLTLRGVDRHTIKSTGAAPLLRCAPEHAPCSNVVIEDLDFDCTELTGVACLDLRDISRLVVARTTLTANNLGVAYLLGGSAARDQLFLKTRCVGLKGTTLACWGVSEGQPVTLLAPEGAFVTPTPTP